MRQVSRLSSTTIHFNGKRVNANVVSVSSICNHGIEIFFAQELIRQNTVKIVRPLARISFLKENLNSEYWEEGFNYELQIKPFGLLNIWGIHHINVIAIDRAKNEITTLEKNNLCKVWNHKLTFKKITESTTEYTDEVTLYAGILTRVLSWFLIYSYKKRHQNWAKLLSADKGKK